MNIRSILVYIIFTDQKLGQPNKYIVSLFTIKGFFCLQNLSNGTLFEYSIQTETKFTIY